MFDTVGEEPRRAFRVGPAVMRRTRPAGTPIGILA